MKFTSAIAAGMLAVAATAQPTKTLEARASQLCGQWDSVATGGYTLYNNLWNKTAGTGSQCTTYDSLSGTKIEWSTSWSWAGGSSSVKSYANVVYTGVSHKALSAIKTLPSSWSWKYTGSNLVADVSYDIFTGNAATGTASYEVMIWLGALGGAGPISSTGKAIATVSLAGQSWKLFKGPNGSTTVFSFVRAGGDVTNFSGDLMTFLNYLVKNQGVSSSQILQSIGAGTEPFTGSNAVLTVSSYSVTQT